MFETSVSTESKEFSDYIEGRTIVIADSSAVARSSISNVLVGLGARQSQIALSSTFQEAVDEIRRVRPHLLIADFDLGKRCGLDLAAEQREVGGSEDSSRAFLIMAGNTSQSAVARAAEEDVDGYIIKPYNVDSVRKALLRVAAEKLKPAEYANAITQGKTRISERKLKDAEKLFSHAITLNPSPTLACYYLGQVKALDKSHEEAKESYIKGLQFNRIHFKCNVGLYDLFLEQKKFEQAYETLKTISHYFPANPKRLGEVLRLAIVTSRYEDIEIYYNVFCQLDEREENLVRHVCAALVVCGKHYLQKGNPSAAVRVLQKACASGRGRTVILRQSVQALLEYSMVVEARKILGKFPPETHGGRDYRIARFLVVEAEGNPGPVIADGHDIIAKDFADALVFEIMIRRSFQAGLPAAAESVTMKAIEKFPRSARSFSSSPVSSSRHTAAATNHSTPHRFVDEKQRSAEFTSPLRFACKPAHLAAFCWMAPSLLRWNPGEKRDAPDFKHPRVRPAERSALGLQHVWFGNGREHAPQRRQSAVDRKHRPDHVGEPGSRAFCIQARASHDGLQRRDGFWLVAQCLEMEFELGLDHDLCLRFRKSLDSRHRGWRMVRRHARSPHERQRRKPFADELHCALV